jgi:chromate transporter
MGTAPQAGWLLYGIKPVVIAIIVQALLLLGRKSSRRFLELGMAVAAVLLSVVGINEIPILLSGGLLVMLVVNRHRLRRLVSASLLGPLIPAGLSLAAAPFSLPLLFLTFLKIGAVLYGSGYVLFAFLQSDLVERLGWLTPSQLVDAVAVGQITPGPLFTSATFIGYILGGVPGALVATVGIFLPSFVFVAAASRLIPLVRQSPWARSFLDGVVAASLGLIAAVAWDLARASLVDPFTVTLAAVALFLLLRFRVNSVWLIAAGALAGLATLALR